MHRIIERLGALRDKLELRQSEFDLNSLVEKAIQSLEGGSDIAFRKEPLPKLIGDRDQLDSVVTNLLLNARDAIAEEGHIQVRTTAQDGWVTFSVSDHDCGMSPTFLRDSLFRPFKTTKEKGRDRNVPKQSDNRRVPRQHSCNERAGTCDHFRNSAASSTQRRMNRAPLILHDDEAIRDELGLQPELCIVPAEDPIGRSRASRKQSRLPGWSISDDHLDRTTSNNWPLCFCIRRFADTTAPALLAGQEWEGRGGNGAELPLCGRAAKLAINTPTLP